MSLVGQALAIARRFGGDPEFTRAGGGNISYKEDGVLHIKPSGTAMADLRAEDFVPLRIDVLRDALHGDAPYGHTPHGDAPHGDGAVAGDPVRAAAERAQIGQPTRRPSVEILFHALIEDAIVFHTHPLVANALTCHAGGPALAEELFGDQACFVPYTDPGVPLARAVEAARAEFTARTGATPPPITFLGNHGIIVSGATAEAVAERIEHLTAVIRSAFGPEPQYADAEHAQAADAEAGSVPLGSAHAENAQTGSTRAEKAEAGSAQAAIAVVAPTLRGLLAVRGKPPVVTSDAGPFVQAETLTEAGQAILVGGPLIPDQIVYAGSLPCVIPPGDDLAAATVAAVAAYRAEHGRDPIVAVVPGVAVFAQGRGWAGARTALGTFTDALRVAREVRRLGGEVRTLTVRERSFIEDWEAEAYRKQVAAGASPGRLDGKVVVVTGAAQGFGLGLAQEALAEGATVVLADLNVALAEENAYRLNAEFGAGRAVALAVDVSDEQSQLDAAAAVTGLLGGLDVFISNAGVLRAGSVFDQPVAEFDLVTQVNYRGYFLGVRAVAPIMARQHAANPEVWGDIVEINSKSGLAGSRRNFAYAGSKFGGVGLTQSFALELVDQGIKVNAVCPGNFLDGPLWSDPERGLFVQYLRAGKVPGARTVADVRRHYEAMVPLGRGCLPADVAKAVFYVVEQAYETGQAVPVTGGQNMLN
ncbi:MAG: SDR family NAD(P)-dependent oxidoreductase [Propionibacteriaceae bacterium]|jgi:NAD(P)-dependent dehydrogenase (short-subunit alcohol dehydrogenase family)/rhamnose utilization protein RhaD (predicted bifunctional aldolase and dehydrogenase)|nr:SDR family NAD(P)-dependent oxidoreductase [Propionibacteriaceae bacterium]